MISPTRCSGSASRSPYRAGRSCGLDVMDLAGSAGSLPGFGADNEMEGPIDYPPRLLGHSSLPVCRKGMRFMIGGYSKTLRTAAFRKSPRHNPWPLPQCLPRATAPR